jgi:hypothetical protein
MLRGLVLALAVSLTFASSALAGGNNGGTKKDATFRIINDLSSQYAVVIDASDELKAKLANDTATIDDLNNAGGKIIQPGKEATFKVKAGTHRIGWVSVAPDGSYGMPAETQRTVGKGKTATYNLSSL